MKRLKMKIEAVAGVLLFLAISVSATVTTTNTSTTTDDSTFMIDFDDNWINVSNMTIGDILASGSITADTFHGDGSALTGISGSGGHNLSWIINSNNNSWSSTGANLQTAIWDLNNASGTVWLGSDITISGVIELGRYTTLDLQGNNVTISGNNNGFSMGIGSHLKNGKIQTTTYSGNMIYIDGSKEFGQGGTGEVYTTIENLDLYNNDNNGTGILFDCSSNDADITFVRIINVKTHRFEYGINMSCYYDNYPQGCHCNGNQISTYTDVHSTYQIYLYRNESATISQGEITGNTYSNIQLQRRSTSPVTLRSIYVSGSTNYFQGIIWDSAGGNRAIELSSTSRRTYINMGSLVNNDIYNNGTNNRIISYDFTTMFPYFAQSSPPTINDNCTAWWYDTDGDWLYQVCNSYGTQFYLNMSTTY